MSKDLVITSLLIVIYGLLGGILMACGFNNVIKGNSILGSIDIILSMLILLKGYAKLKYLSKRL